MPPFEILAAVLRTLVPFAGFAFCTETYSGRFTGKGTFNVYVYVHGKYRNTDVHRDLRLRYHAITVLKGCPSVNVVVTLHIAFNHLHTRSLRWWQGAYVFGERMFASRELFAQFSSLLDLNAYVPCLCLPCGGITSVSMIQRCAFILRMPKRHIHRENTWFALARRGRLCYTCDTFRAIVAQLDRALASEAKGCGFDPRLSHHFCFQREITSWLLT